MQIQSDAMIGLLTDRGILPDTGIGNEKVRGGKKGEAEEHLPQYHDAIAALPDDCVAF